MNQCKVNKRELEIVDQTQTQRYVSRFEHTALRPRLNTEGFLLTRPHRTSHTRNPLRIWANTIWEYTTPLSTNTTFTLRGKAQHKSPLHLEGWALSQTTINLTLEG